MNKGILYTVFLLVLSFKSFSQTSGILVRNAPENATISPPVIQLKWYDQETIFRKGEVNIYRKSETESWIKLNDKPIKIGQYIISEEKIQKDSSLKAFKYMLDNIPSDSVQGFMLLALMVKSFQSNDFAKYAAIMYEDVQVERGKKYQYKVVVLQNGTEKEIGVSDEIVCGNYVPPTPPKNVEIKPKKRSTEFKWKIETDRYFGVNIYRTPSDSSKEVKITPQPLMASKRVDKKTGEKKYGDALYVDKDLREKITYTYRMTSVDFFGTETDFTPGIAAFVADSTAPLPPQNLRFEVQKYKVILKWEERTDADLGGYYIYKGKTSTGTFDRISEQLLPSGQTMFEENTKDGNYYYYVSSADQSGNESPSNKVFVHVHDIEPPLTPQNIEIRSDTGRIYLNWLPNQESDLMGYQVFRSIDNEDTSHFVLINAKLFIDALYIDSLPKNAKNTFMYKIVAVDSSYNRSLPSKAIGIKMPDVTPPEQPLIKNASMKKDDILIEWIANVDDDLWGYNVQRSSEKDTSGFKQINLNLIPAHSTHYTDRNTEAGVVYNYYLVAIDSSGNHSIPSEIFTVRDADSSSGSGTSVTSAKARLIKKNGQIHLAWEVASKDLLGCVVYRKEKEEDTMEPLTGLMSMQEFYDKGVRNEQTYFYEIRAYSASGTMQKSEVLKVETKNK